MHALNGLSLADVVAGFFITWRKEMYHWYNKVYSSTTTSTPTPPPPTHPPTYPARKKKEKKKRNSFIKMCQSLLKFIVSLLAGSLARNEYSAGLKCVSKSNFLVGAEIAIEWFHAQVLRFAARSDQTRNRPYEDSVKCGRKRADKQPIVHAVKFVKHVDTMLKSCLLVVKHYIS